MCRWWAQCTVRAIDRPPPSRLGGRIGKRCRRIRDQRQRGISDQADRERDCTRAVLGRLEQKAICRPGPGQGECMKAKQTPPSSSLVKKKNGPRPTSVVIAEKRGTISYGLSEEAWKTVPSTGILSSPKTLPLIPISRMELSVFQAGPGSQVAYDERWERRTF